MIVGSNTYSERRQKRSRKEICTLIKVEPVITFDIEDGKDIRHLLNEALVISAYLNNYLIKKILVNDRSAVNVLS